MSKAAKALIEDAELQRDAEILELVGFARTLYKDNLRLTQELQTTKTKDKKGFLEKLTASYDMDRIARLTFWMIIVVLILTLFTAVINHGPTGEYYLASCTLTSKSDEHGNRT